MSLELGYVGLPGGAVAVRLWPVLGAKCCVSLPHSDSKTQRFAHGDARSTRTPGGRGRRVDAAMRTAW